jgi:tetratricopeptide (TPR) repeat protein
MPAMVWRWRPYCSPCSNSRFADGVRRIDAVAQSRGGGEELAAGAGELRPGRRLGRYQLQEPLGRGGAGAVFRAVDEASGTQVALKVLAPQGGDVEAWGWRLRREFYQMAQLEHPHIVRVLDWGEEGELHYYAMELLLGHDAGKLAPMAPAQVVEVLAAVGSALALLHARGLLHQDVKPHNIVIPDGDDGQPALSRARLIDFGLLRPIRDAGGERAGTPGFMAPEVLLGAPPDERADLYSLGATGYALLAGRLPPQPAGLADPTPPLPPAPEALSALLGELLAADPRKRPPGMSEVLDRLGRMGARLDLSDASRASAYLTRPPLVGRGPALETLRAVWGRAASGEGQVAFVVGTPGLGRSRLLADFALELRVAGAEVGEARGGPGLPGTALVELVWPWLRDPGLMATVPLSSRRTLESLAVGHTTARRLDLSAIGEAVMQLVEAAARRRPVALVMDDLEACDPVSLSALERLARSDRGRCLLVLAVGAEPAEREGLVRRLRQGTAQVVVLEPLGEDGVQALLASIFGDTSLSRSVVATLTTRSGGRPDILLALCRELLERGSIVFLAGRWQLPRRLELDELTLSGRLARPDRWAPRSDDERLLLELLEVAEGRLDTGSLAQSSGLPSRRLVAALEALRLRGAVVVQRVRADLEPEVAVGGRAVVRPPGGSSSGSGSLGAQLASEQVALDPLAPRPDLDAARRKELAERLSRVVERRLGRPELSAEEHGTLEASLGRLLVQRGAQHEVEGAGWLARAGTGSYLRGAFADAVRSLRQATAILEAHGGPELHPELLDLWEQLAVCQVSGDITQALACLLRIESFLDRRGELTRISSAEQRLGPRLGTLQGLLAVAVERAVGRRAASILDLPGELERYARTLGYLGAVRCLLGLLDEAGTDIARLDLLARARGGTAIAAGLFARANWQFARGRVREAIGLSQEVLEVLARGGTGLPPEQHERVAVWAQFISFWSRALLAEPDLDLRVLTTLHTDDELANMHALMVPVVFHGERGDVNSMLRARAVLFQKCFRLRPTFQEAFVYAPSARALLDAGLTTQLREDVATLESLDFPACPQREILYRLIPGLLLLAEGEPGRALELFEEVVQRSRSPRTGSLMFLVHVLDHTSDALLMTGRLDEAAARAREVVAVSRDPQLRLLTMEARGQRTLARLELLAGRPERAEQHLTTAAHLNAVLRSPGEAAQQDLLRAEIFLATGGEREAAVCAARAEARLAELGNAAGARRALVLGQRAAAAGHTAELRIAPLDPTAPTELGPEGAAATTLDPRLPEVDSA